jgi:hypothetical protein
MLLSRLDLVRTTYRVQAPSLQYPGENYKWNSGFEEKVGVTRSQAVHALI